MENGKDKLPDQKEQRVVFHSIPEFAHRRQQTMEGINVQVLPKFSRQPQSSAYLMINAVNEQRRSQYQKQQIQNRIFKLAQDEMHAKNRIKSLQKKQNFMMDMNSDKLSRLSALDTYKQNLLNNEQRNRDKFRQIRDDARRRRQLSKDSLLNQKRQICNEVKDYTSELSEQANYEMQTDLNDKRDFAYQLKDSRQRARSNHNNTLQSFYNQNNESYKKKIEDTHLKNKQTLKFITTNLEMEEEKCLQRLNQTFQAENKLIQNLENMRSKKYENQQITPSRLGSNNSMRRSNKYGLIKEYHPCMENNDNYS